MPLAYWVHNLSPFLVRFSENFGIRYYGLAYLMGFIGAVALLRFYHRRGRSPLGPDAVTDLITFIVVGVLVGGRLGSFVLYDHPSVREDPWALFRVWEGGMASHGGFVGVTLAVLWYAHRRKVSFFLLADLIATTAPLGLLFGRIANFINGELVGKASTAWCAIIFPKNEIDRALGQAAVPRHPSQLYEAALEGAVLLAFVQWRFWRSDVARTQPGRLSGEFLITYAVLRMIGELFREPDASLLLGVSRGTFYSVFLIAAGLWLIARGRNGSTGSASV